MFSHFDVKKGFAGKIENKVRFDVAGFNSKGKAVSWNTEQDMNDHQKLTGPRNANVVPVPVGTVPVAKTQVALDKSNGGVIQSGSNRVTGYLQTDNSSTLPLDSNLNAMVLLSVGVTVDKTSPNYQLSNERGSWDTRTIDGTNANGNIKIISNNYKNTKQQLVKVEWNAFSLQPGRAVGYGFNVNVSASAPSPLKIDTYGFSGNKQFKVPEKATALNDSYLETDSDDLNGDGNTNQNRVRSSNQYRIVKENRIITTKLVKGDQDKGFSKFGHTSPGGTIDYQLTMKNNGSAIGTFALIDVLPSVGDLGITDNVRRDSKFAPIMTGPISLPGEWNGKVTVYYSEATNPKRDSLDKLVTYPSTTQHLENPLGAQEPLWKTADQVKNWGNIHSFMIGLNKGEWTSGVAITVNFSMKTPNDLPKNLTDKTKNEDERAAWNSFAYTAENAQVVEPERVGVVVNGEEPTIHKDIEGKQQLDLINRNDEGNSTAFKGVFPSTGENQALSNILLVVGIGILIILTIYYILKKRR